MELWWTVPRAKRRIELFVKAKKQAGGAELPR